MEGQITVEQRKIWSDIRKAFEDLRAIESKKTISRSLKQLLIDLSENEEDDYLIAAMEEVKHELPVSTSEAVDFENWLNQSIANYCPSK